MIDNVSTNPTEDLRKLRDMIALNYLIGNCDAHLKNVALLRDAMWRELRLLPAYDLICTVCCPNSSRRLAMSIGGAHSIDDVSIQSFENLARTMRIPLTRALSRLEELTGSIEGAVESALAVAEARGVTRAELGERILSEVRKNATRL